MALIPWQRRDEWDPFRDLLGLQKEMNKLFDSSVSKSIDKRTDLLEGFWAPAVDIQEEKDRYLIKADLPGIKQEEIDDENVGCIESFLGVSGVRL